MLSAWGSAKVRPRPPVAELVSAVLAILLVLVVANSTITADWVQGLSVLVRLGLLAGLIGGVLGALRRLPWPAGLLALAILAPIGAFAFTGPRMLAAHPGDPHGIGYLHAWWVRILDGDALNDLTFYLYLLALMFWFTAGWLTWCVVRWGQPLLGVVPAGAALATNILNFPSGQSGYTLAFLVITLTLLLWVSYQRSVAQARAAGTRLSGDARWDFWEKGALVLAGMIILSIFIPPLSTADRTVDIQSGLFRGWASVQQRLNHPVALGTGTASGSSIGFASDVPLGGPIHKSGGTVLTYTVEGISAGPAYFRGLNLTEAQAGRWRYGRDSIESLLLSRNQPARYAEQYGERGRSAYAISILRPPRGNESLVFYPGELVQVNRDTVAFEAAVPGVIGGPTGLDTIDRVRVPTGAAATYQVVSSFSTASEAQLRAAPASYPDWLAAYRTYRSAAPGTYRTPRAEARIQQLARQVTASEGNPYDRASAIERYLRSSLTYTLSPPEPPPGSDPLEYFLFSSKQGYCEYFATAMGDMLRSLGIPTRLVNGFGPGAYDEKVGKYVVRESDAHTWVESYFPGYGWIPFEPTPDGAYFPIARASGVSAVCAELGVCDPGQEPGGVPGDPNPKPDAAKDPPQPVAPGPGRALRLPRWLQPVPAFAVLAALLALIAFAAVRYLRPRTVDGVWRRVRLLSRVAGVATREAETPTEFGARLARHLPGAGDEVSRLVDGFVVAAYAPPAAASGSLDSVLEAWQAVRPRLLSLAAQRLRHAH